MKLVDTNVLLDIVTNDPAWAAWSLRQLEAAELQGALVVNSVVYAELSVRFRSLQAVEEKVAELGLTVATIPRLALFLAGKAYQRYRRAGGARTGVLPDFFIGAHAAAEGLPLITRDPRRFRTYFPDVQLVCP